MAMIETRGLGLDIEFLISMIQNYDQQLPRGHIAIDLGAYTDR